MSGRELNALLGRGATYSGDLAFEGRVRVDGHFSGKIYTEEVLEIGESGQIEGQIDAAFAIVAGAVDGVLVARERLTIEPTGRVTGEVRARELVVRPGATLDARVRSGGLVE